MKKQYNIQLADTSKILLAWYLLQLRDEKGWRGCDLNMLTYLKEAEIAGLRKAAEVVNYNLDDLDRKQKKILIDLFVDRVEMNRIEKPSEGKRPKWDIQAKVIFRFVPDKFTSAEKVGRTKKGLTKAEVVKIFGKNERDGGSGGT